MENIVSIHGSESVYSSLQKEEDRTFCLWFVTMKERDFKKPKQQFEIQNMHLFCYIYILAHSVNMQEH